MFLHVSVILFTRGVVVSQHALQVSRGWGSGILACLAGGIPGCLTGVRGVSRPTPRGSQGPHPEGVSRPTPGGCIQACTEADPPEAVHAGRYGQQADGTHSTGMHSCNLIIAASKVDRFNDNSSAIPVVRILKRHSSYRCLPYSRKTTSYPNICITERKSAHTFFSTLVKNNCR